VIYPLVYPGLFVVLILGRVLRKAYTEVDDPFVDVWARSHALELTPANRPMVRWYLHTARVLRTWGAVAGFFLPPLIGAAFGSPAVTNALFPLVFVGYLAGALYAEVALVRPVSGDRRVAALVPRELEDYLPRPVVASQRVLPALVVATAVASVFVTFNRDRAAGLSGSPRASSIGVAVFAIAFSLLLERVERWLLRRPQPFTSADLVAADDAIRSQSVHSLSGSGLAVLLVCLATGFYDLARSDVQFLRWTMWIPALGCFAFSISTCLYYGHRAWRVRRSVPSSIAAA
jgi:hypothetical protein